MPLQSSPIPAYNLKQYGPGDFTLANFTPVHETDEPTDFGFAAEFVGHAYAFFGAAGVLDNKEATAMLIAAGVLKEENADPESCCFHANYGTLTEAEAFIERLNAYLQHRLDTEPPTKEIYDRLKAQQCPREVADY